MSIFDVFSNNDGGTFAASETETFLGGSTVSVNSGTSPSFMGTVKDEDGNSYFVTSTNGNRATLSAAPSFASADYNPFEEKKPDWF